MGERKCAYRVFVEKPEGKIQLGRPRHRWEDNIKMDLREVGDLDWIVLVQLVIELCLVFFNPFRKFARLPLSRTVTRLTLLSLFVRHWQLTVR